MIPNKNQISSAALIFFQSTLPNYQKGRALRRLVETGKDNEADIFDFIADNFPEVGPFFYELDEKEKVIQRKAPPGRSASQWTYEELDFYGIKVKNVYKWDPEMVKKVVLPPKAQKFIDEISFFNEGVMTNTPFKELGNKNWPIFLTKCYFSYLYDNVEAKMDDLLEEFLENVMDLKFFGFSVQQIFPLKVNNYDGEAKTNVCGYYYELELPGVVVAEDKLKAGSSSNEGEPQVIAQCIGVSQQPFWPKSRPIFFFRARGFEIFFYFGYFSQDLCELVKLGKPGTVETEVLKYVSKKVGNNRGLNLLNPADRFELAEICCSIGEAIKQHDK